MAIGRSRTFHRPMAKKAGARTTNSDRSVGVPAIVLTPSRRFATTRPTDAGSSLAAGSSRRRSIRMQPAENTKVRASIQNAQSMLSADASSPAPANPIAVEPNEAIDR